MRYFGSKASTLSRLLQIVRMYVSSGTFCDPFGGIATVGAHFKSAGYRVTTGDQLRFATYFQVARVGYSSVPQFSKLKRKLRLSSASEVVEHLNGLQPVDGWFVREYSRKRAFFSIANARRVEAVRRRIQLWKSAGLLSERERAFLLASLIDSADRVANTAGTYYAHLKGWTRKAKLPFRFVLLQPAKGIPGKTIRGDALELVQSGHFSVLYLDPPYNERCYGGYYHLPETIASVRPRRAIHGASGVPLRYARSPFNSPIRAANALRELVANARFDILVFHYSDDGLVTAKEITEILSKFGSVRTYTVRSSGYTTKKMRREIVHRVYIVKSPGPNGKQRPRLASPRRAA
jgi:adenine-specific DNA-methyltransferase